MLAFCVLLRYLLFTFLNNMRYFTMIKKWCRLFDPIEFLSSWLILVRYLFHIISLYLRMYLHTYVHIRYILCVGENNKWKVNNFETLRMDYDSIGCISIRNRKIRKEYFASDTMSRKSVIIYIDLLAKAFDMMGALGLNGTHR